MRAKTIHLEITSYNKFVPLKYLHAGAQFSGFFCIIYYVLSYLNCIERLCYIMVIVTQMFAL